MEAIYLCSCHLYTRDIAQIALNVRGSTTWRVAEPRDVENDDGRASSIELLDYKGTDTRRTARHYDNLTS